MRILKTVLKISLALVLLLVLVVAGLALSLRATLPEDTFDLQPVAASAADPRPVLIFGATRNTGYEVAKILRARGQSVTAAVRASSDRSMLAPLGVDFVVADAVDAQAVSAAVASNDFQAIVTTIACSRCEPPPDFLGNKNIIDAAKAQSVDRLVLITTVGAGDSYEAANLLSRYFLRDILPMKTQAEDYLKASGVDYTIIRPGGLRSNETSPTGGGVLTEDRSTLGFIHRTDVAELIVAVLDDERTRNRTFAALDPAIDSPWD